MQFFPFVSLTGFFVFEELRQLSDVKNKKGLPVWKDLSVARL